MAIADRQDGLAAAWHAWMAQRQEQTHAAIRAHLDALRADGHTTPGLLEAVAYCLEQPGKRLRPILVVECCRVCGGTLAGAMPVAIAVECVHTFSLIHDDLPALDDDDLRRGRPTCHRVFGEATALLAGDWLLAHALWLAAQAPRAGEALVAELAAAVGAMIVGQHADLEGARRPPDREQVRFIHLHKTARLMEACCRLGARCAAAPSELVERLGRYGRHLGLAFQITDDLLDCQGVAEVVGKRVGKDAGQSKQTYPAALGVEQSLEEARREIDQALAQLDGLGPEADHLRGLARFVLTRQR